MKTYLIELATKPNNTQRLQMAESAAALCILAENMGLHVHSLRELAREEAGAFQHGGIRWGLSGIVETVPVDNSPIVTERNASKHTVYNYSVEASTLGIRPGPFPKHLSTSLGNKQPFILQRVDEPGTAHYMQSMGCISLHVFND